MNNIPRPNNPQHVDNLRSIELLKAQDFAGSDACLATSLFEYRMVWRDLGEEWLIVYQHPSLKDRFDRLTLAKAIDPRKEWDWVRWGELLSFTGMTEEDFFAQGLMDIVYSLLLYYGTEEIFGSSYWEGFEVSCGDDEVRSDGREACRAGGSNFNLYEHTFNL